MDFYDCVMLWSFIVSLLLGPFVVGSRNPVIWILYLGMCTILPPILGFPIYRTFFR